jgi:hypothetical protein
MQKRPAGGNFACRTSRITAAVLLGTTVAVLVLTWVYHQDIAGTAVAVLIGLPGLWLSWVPYRDDQRGGTSERAGWTSVRSG